MYFPIYFSPLFLYPLNLFPFRNLHYYYLYYYSSFLTYFLSTIITFYCNYYYIIIAIIIFLIITLIFTISTIYFLSYFSIFSHVFLLFITYILGGGGHRAATRTPYSTVITEVKTQGRYFSIQPYLFGHTRTLPRKGPLTHQTLILNILQIPTRFRER